MSTRPRASALRRTAAVCALASGALLAAATGAFADAPSPAPSTTASAPTHPTVVPEGGPWEGDLSEGGASEGVVPEGSVRAGADGVPEGGNPAFLIAGGGMAAAGAGGLGFAMMRRGRTDA
ncbi:hypothetical protein [Streptomyces sp. G45]|uniref:hypothetical protein n=1 Tax=Streptomyces sp. G45 TaxID=3406627 RepID=UPI003C1FEAD8